MIKIAKTRIFGNFRECGASDRHIIAYLDRTKQCALFAHRTILAGSSKIQENAFLNDPNSPKRGFWTFSGVINQINLILHIVVELNGVHYLPVVQLILDHSKIRKMPF